MVELLDPRELKRLRRELGITQRDLARAAGVSQSLIARIESGDIDPRVSTYSRIVKALRDLQQRKERVAREIMTSPVITVAPSTPLERAIALMREKGISQLPVVEEGIQVGCLTEEDILRIVERENGRVDLFKLKVEDVMGEGLPIVGEETPLSAILPLLKHKPAVLVAGRGGKLKGIITKIDVIKAFEKP